jgi:hypothetical protein
MYIDTSEKNAFLKYFLARFFAKFVGRTINSSELP